MKLKYFYGSIAVVQEDGYTNNLEFGTTEDSNGNATELSFRYPYGNISLEKAKAVATFTKTIADAFETLKSQLVAANRVLKEEEFAPIVIESSMNGAEETTSEETETTESEGL